MRVALYVRVSTDRQQQAQTIEQQVAQLHSFVAAHEGEGWTVAAEHIFRDDGCSGARLDRPGLDALRDQAARAAFDLVLVTAPDRLARNFVHQMVVMEELQRRGVRVVFIDRPLTDDPHEQLVTQIRGAVAEYERTLIADRMRRGRLARLRSGQLLPWTRAPYGYRLHPERPRDPAAVEVDPVAAVIVQELFAAYAAGGATLHTLAAQLTARGVPTPTGKTIWRPATIRQLLTNPAYKGEAASGRLRTTPARHRWSPLAPVGKGQSTTTHPPEEWITVPVPAVVSAEQFELVQRRLATNQRSARRNTRHPYLLRGLVSCGVCRLGCSGVTRSASDTRYRYYRCRGKQAKVSSGRQRPCTARFIPASQLDELVWADLCAVLQHPEHVAQALQRAHSGAWVPGELRRRQATLHSVRASVARRRQRLLEAYLAEVIDLGAFQRQDRALAGQEADLLAREREVSAQGQRLVQVSAIAHSMTAVLERLRVGLDQADFQQRRQLVELLIDRVVVTDGQVEIRYVIPTTDHSTKTRFCHLRTDYFDVEAAKICPPQQAKIGRAGAGAPQPQHVRRAVGAGGGGGVLDLDPQQRAAHDRPAAGAALLGVDPLPGHDGDRAVAVGGLGVGGGRRGPGALVTHGQLVAVAAGPASAARASGWGGKPEAAVVAHPHQQLHIHLGQVHGQPGQVVALVQAHQRPSLGGVEPAAQCADLGGGHRGSVLVRAEPAQVDRLGPAVGGQVQPAHPLEGPGGHDRLAGGVAAGMVVPAASRAGGGVRPRPGGGVHRKQRPAAAHRQPRQQLLEPAAVQLAVGQGVVGGGPAAPVHRRQAQRGQAGNVLAARQRVAQLKQRIGTADQTVVEPLAERAQHRKPDGRIGLGRRAVGVHTTGDGHRVPPSRPFIR
jgi:site-specific DNA recombinase